jgi:putative two-component system response regulator
MAEKKTVLIVDDQSDCRLIVETVISEIGDFRILQASGGEDAYSLCLKEAPDLIITDLVMPGMDGFSLIRNLMKRESMKGVPFIYLTGVSEGRGSTFTAEGIGKSIGFEPAAFLEKPVDPAALSSAIRAALRP